MKSILTEPDQKRIQEAVASAEGVTSGEIVPYVVGKSDDYPESVWKGALLGAILAAGIVLLLGSFYTGWGLAWLFTAWGVSLVALAAGVLGAGIATAPSVKRLLTRPSDMHHRVHDRAMRAFLEEDMFNTRDRTGILLFVSLFEHHIEVIGDEGINRKVETDEWIGVVEEIRAGIKEGKPADGLVRAIESCGELLRTRKVEIRDDDTDELSNRIRISES